MTIEEKVAQLEHRISELERKSQEHGWDPPPPPEEPPPPLPPRSR